MKKLLFLFFFTKLILFILHLQILTAEIYALNSIVVLDPLKITQSKAEILGNILGKMVLFLLYRCLLL